jgi:hypothetical protein
MGILNDALPRDAQAKRATEQTVKSDYGVHDAQFIGMTPDYVYVNDFEKCRVCKGSGLGRKEGESCFLCTGNGKRTEKRVKLQYKMRSGILEEEEVNFKLSPPGTGKDGTPLSPSTLFIRLRTFSRLRDATPAQLDEWYTTLEKPIKIAVSLVIEDNKNATALKITNVMLRGGATAAPTPPTPPPTPPPNDVDDNYDDLPF